MCVVSMVGDHYNDKWEPFKKYIQEPLQVPPYNPLQDIWEPKITKKEFDELKKEVEEMKELLKKAIEYDKRNNEPHCEIEEKMVTLKKIAELVGVDLTDILK